MTKTQMDMFESGICQVMFAMSLTFVNPKNVLHENEFFERVFIRILNEWWATIFRLGSILLIWHSLPRVGSISGKQGPLLECLAE